MKTPEPMFAVSITEKNLGSLVWPVGPAVVDVVVDVELIMISISSDL